MVSILNIKKVMTNTISNTLDELQNLLITVTDDSNDPYFNKVWIGLPDNLLLGTKYVAVIEVQGHPDFYYTSCKSNTFYDTRVLIHIFTKGTLETANIQLYNITELVLNKLLLNRKLNYSVIDSTIEHIEYDCLQSERSKQLVSVSAITLNCKHTTKNILK